MNNRKFKSVFTGAYSFDFELLYITFHTMQLLSHRSMFNKCADGSELNNMRWKQNELTIELQSAVTVMEV